MIETFIDNDRLLVEDSTLADHYIDGKQNWNDKIETALDEMEQDLKDMGMLIRKICIPLSLFSETSFTSSTNGSTTTEDRVERRRVVVKVTSISATAIFKLQGRNSSSASWADVVNLTVENNDEYEYTTTFRDTYKYYRLNLTNDSTITCSAYLIERTYEKLHLYKTLETIYRELYNLGTETSYWEKYQDYRNLYREHLSNLRPFYDEDDDESIDETESKQTLNEVRFI